MTASAFRQQLRERLERDAARVLLRIVIAGETIEFTGREILDQASALAARYRQVPESSVVLLLLPHSTELFLLHLGLILEGRIPAILAWPTSRIDPEKYQRNLVHQLRNLPASLVITLPRLAANMGPSLPYPAVECPIPSAAQFENTFAIPPRIEKDSLAQRPPAQAAPGDALFLQFSGGTTGAQKAVVVTAPILEAQLRRLGEFLGFTSNDAVASWLPMYHDMGLIGCLWFPLWYGAPSLQFSATDWLMNPESLFEYMQRYRGTFCWLPNFAFSYLAAQKDRMKGSYSLGHVRGWISCSEPVRQISMHAFEEAFAEWGVRGESLLASYAMAENVFAVTQTSPGSRPATFARGALKQRTLYSPLAFDLIDEVYVSSGWPIAGMEVRIAGQMDGMQTNENQPGEIQLRTESLFQGYWGNDGFLTTSLSSDGWYSTGDYGFIDGRDLFVIGRMKDIVIVGGQNVFPEDVEAVVNSVDGVYPGRVVAFGVTDNALGTESLAVIAEQRGDYARPRALEMQREIQKLVLSTIGLAPRYCFVVPERWIVKSTAGKISRRETRARFQTEQSNLAVGAFPIK